MMKTVKLSVMLFVFSVFLSASPVLAFTLTVNVSPPGSGLIGSWPGTIYCESCSGEFSFGEEVILTAYYNSGYQFDHWEGDLSGNMEAGTLFMDSDKSVTAVFVPISTPQTLTVNVSPAGSGKVGSWPGTIYCESCSGEFPSGQEVILTAYPDSGYQFDHWEGDLSDTMDSAILVMDAPKSVMAVFVPVENPQTLTVTVQPPEGGIVGSWPEGIWCPDGPCEADFPQGEEVIVTAQYNSGFVFDHWEGDISSTMEVENLFMDGPKSVTAVFVPVENPQTLTVTVQPPEGGIVGSWPEGIWCPDGPCEADFPQGEEVIVTAQYNSGFVFDHWEGDISSTMEVENLFMDGPKTVTAVFIPMENPQTLIVKVQPADGGVVGSWPEGIWCPDGPCEWDFPQDEEVILTPYPNSGYQFDHWESDADGSLDSEVFISDTAQTVTAVFVKIDNPQKLTVKVEPSGAGGLTSWPDGICCPDGLCEWEFPQGTEVILTAYFMTGYEFDHWEGDLEGREISKPVMMDSAKTVTAVFKEISNPQTLAVTVQPAEAGIVSSWPEGIWCPDGPCEWNFPLAAEVELYAEINPGFRFDHWEGDLSGTGVSQKLILNGPKSVKAVFIPFTNPEKLTVSISPAGSGFVDSDPSGISCPERCQSDFVHGEDVFLVATPEEGFIFDQWQGALSGTEDSGSILMDAPKTVTAVFAQGMEFPEELTPVGMKLQDLGIISFIYWPLNPDSRSIFGDDVAKNYGKDFRMGSYDPVKGDYNEYGPNLKIEPGRALWFLSKYPYNIRVKGTPVSLTEDFDLPLLYNPATGDGWNMISCPNDAWYDWNEMEILADGQKFRISDPGSENCISLRFWKWVEGNYVFYDAEGPVGNEKYLFDPDSVLKPFEGYWVKARKANVTLRFPVTAQVDKEAEMKFRSFTGTRRSSSSGENPPAPVTGFDQNSTVSEDSVGGCFISTLFGE